ncbi:MAG TPA: outer membrane protein assembly factor BamA, partial [Candidatus Krumholzibacteria bacterium]|nr:outer membrane protein assembly factor BamA [Candidatus Krumholzibacteria bacterium]
VRAQGSDPPPDDRVVFVNRIAIVGNQSVETAVLRARMRTKEPSFFSILRKPKFDREQIERDAAQLEAYYHAIGYPDATVRIERVDYLENGRFADVTIRVVEGEPIRVATVSFPHPLVVDEAELRKKLLLAPGKPYNASLLQTDVYRIKTEHYNLGYLGVLVIDSTTVIGRQVDIRFIVDPGLPLNVGAIVVEGNRLVRRSVIDAEIELRSGDVCRFEKVVKTQRNLFETGLFNVVDVLPENVDPVRQTVDIRIRVRERKQSWIETGFGVGNVLGSRIFAEWGTRNLFGTGRTLRFKAQYAFDLFAGDDIDFNQIDISNTYYRYDAVYQQRRIFGIKLGAGVNAFIEEDRTVPNLEVKTQGTTFGVAHNFGRPRRDFGYDTEVVGTFSIENITRREFGLPEEESRSNILGGSLSRDRRDFVLNPRRGEYRVVTAAVAGGILGGKNDYYAITGNEQRYHGRGASVLAWRARVGYSAAYGRSDRVPVEDRFYLGGANSVRGYDEASLGPRSVESGESVVDGGEFMALANVEFRYPLPLLGRWNFAGTFFLDGGNVWGSASDVTASDFRLSSDVSETEVDDFRYGIGLGVRYNTPIGPIRVDWGYPLKPDVYTDESGTFYLSLGQIF